ncbi:transketolase-like TK C-terminal-containing protein [Azospirillum oryzae]|uniref:transketolase-like TK C-terminal-containing protein n=1 Tax=Azospirillum oryzae TaxID=286727 RepID=UPI003CCD3F15
MFEQQDQAYRRAVIDRSTLRVTVEAAVVQGWERYIGEDGGFVGMTGFGASGAVPDLYRHFGITPDRVAEEARATL